MKWLDNILKEVGKTIKLAEDEGYLWYIIISFIVLFIIIMIWG